METQKKRRWFQAVAAAAFNAHIPSFFKGSIYQGPSKGLCVPVLNCYSCPSALGACPIGSLQNSLGSVRLNLSLGQASVRPLCHRLPRGRRQSRRPSSVRLALPLRALPGARPQDPLAQVRRPEVPEVFQVRLPRRPDHSPAAPRPRRVRRGEPWFCKWVCPAGTLEAGIPLALLNPSIRGQIGLLFAWKMAVLAGFLVWMVFVMRPFCRTTCPLGGHPRSVQQGEPVPDDRGRGNLHALRQMRAGVPGRHQRL